MYKVLYVCPYANYAGHHPYVTQVEPEMLRRHGVDVDVLTFNGISSQPAMTGKHYKALNMGRFIRRLWKLVETVVTLGKAVYMSRDYDIVMMRDGEPFPFLTHMANLVARNGTKWIISMMGTLLYSDTKEVKYRLIMRLLNSIIWRPIYWLSMHRGNVMLVTQNEAVKKDLCRTKMFNGNVKVVEWGMPKPVKVTKSEAREKLCLPDNKLVLLSFGAPHTGKDMECMMKALSISQEVILLHGGAHTYSLGGDPEKLAEEYGISKEKLRMHNYYISEVNKPYFFGAADVVLCCYTKAFKSTASIIWDAANYNVPVIASDENMVGKVVWDYGLGLLYRTGDYKSLAKTIEGFKYVKGARQKEWANNSASFTADYSEERWADKYLGIFKEMLE